MMVSYTTGLAGSARIVYGEGMDTTNNRCRLCDGFVPASRRVCEACAMAPPDYRDAFTPGRLVEWQSVVSFDSGKDTWTTTYRGEVLDDDDANGEVVVGMDLAHVSDYVLVRCDQELLKRPGCDDKLTLHQTGRSHAVHVSLLAIDAEAEAERVANR